MSPEDIEIPIDCDFDDEGEPSELVVAEVRDHDTFGEIAIVTDRDRQFNAHAMKGTVLFFIEKLKFRALLQSYENRIYQQQIDYVRKVSCFKNLSFRKLKFFVDVCHRTHLKAGQYIFKEGEKAKNIFILAEGEAVVIKQFEILKHKYVEEPSAVFSDLNAQKTRIKTRIKDGGLQKEEL